MNRKSLLLGFSLAVLLLAPGITRASLEPTAPPDEANSCWCCAKVGDPTCCKACFEQDNPS